VLLLLANFISYSCLQCRKFNQLLYFTKQEELADKLIKFVEKNMPKSGFILSSAVQRTFLNTMLENKYYLKYFAFLGEIQQVLFHNFPRI
jgi:hypothetical protein